MAKQVKASVPDQTAKNEAGDFARATDFMRRLVAVPRAELMRKLDAEKRAKTASRVPVSSEAKA